MAARYSIRSLTGMLGQRIQRAAKQPVRIDGVKVYTSIFLTDRSQVQALPGAPDTSQAGSFPREVPRLE